MNGKILLKYWKDRCDSWYGINRELYGESKHSKDFYIRRDSIAHVIYLLEKSEDINKEQSENLLKMLHSLDESNWTVVECIIEAIDTDKQLPNNY